MKSSNLRFGGNVATLNHYHDRILDLGKPLEEKENHEELTGDQVEFPMDLTSWLSKVQFLMLACSWTLKLEAMEISKVTPQLKQAYNFL